MTFRPLRKFRDDARDAIHEAGQHVADVVTATGREVVRVAAGALLAGVVLGAALVWLGVSLARQGT